MSNIGSLQLAASWHPQALHCLHEMVACKPIVKPAGLTCTAAASGRLPPQRSGGGGRAPGAATQSAAWR